MKKPSCCEFHKRVECAQGSNCPLRSPCHATDDLHDDTGFLICRGLALAVFVGSVVMYLVL